MSLVTKVVKTFPTPQLAIAAYREQVAKQQLFINTDELLNENQTIELTLRCLKIETTATFNAQVQYKLTQLEAQHAMLGTTAGYLVFINLKHNADILRPFFVACMNRQKTPTITIHTEIHDEVRELIQRSHETSLYNFFKLDDNAHIREIRVAFQNLIKRLHPDRYRHHTDPNLLPLLENAYQIVNEIYAILSNTAKRKHYDKIRSHAAMSLAEYKNAYDDYLRKNAAGVRKALPLINEAKDAIRQNKLPQAQNSLTLAQKFDPFSLDYTEAEVMLNIAKKRQ